MSHVCLRECGSGETGDHVSGHVTATRMLHLNGTEGIFVETAGLLELEVCGSEKRAECDLPRRAQVRCAVILHKRHAAADESDSNIVELNHLSTRFKRSCMLEVL